MKIIRLWFNVKTSCLTVTVTDLTGVSWRVTLQFAQVPERARSSPQLSAPQHTPRWAGLPFCRLMCPRTRNQSAKRAIWTAEEASVLRTVHRETEREREFFITGHGRCWGHGGCCGARALPRDVQPGRDLRTRRVHSWDELRRSRTTSVQPHVLRRWVSARVRARRGCGGKRPPGDVPNHQWRTMWTQCAI